MLWKWAKSQVITFAFVHFLIVSVGSMPNYMHTKKNKMCLPIQRNCSSYILQDFLSDEHVF